jgi:catechol 2,3-dioxygenase-like lactoylglutathione lyase family enzyme
MKQATEPAQTGAATTTIASTVMRVAELDRSVNFYRDVFCCRVALREPDTALLLTPDGFQIYLHSTGPSRRPRLAPIGIQYLMWATDSQAELERVTTRLRAHDQATYTYTENGVTFVEGCDPDHGRVIIAYHHRVSQPEPAATRADRVAAARGGTCRDGSKRLT